MKDCLLRGLKGTEIARELGVGDRTIYRALASMRIKLGVENTQELILALRAREAG